MTMIITFWVTSAVLWIISVWTNVFFFFFFLILQYRPVSNGSLGAGTSFLLHIISPRTDQRIKYSLRSNIPAKALQIFITFSPLTIKLPLSICMCFMSRVLLHALVHESAALCTNDHVNDMNPIWRLRRCFICAALLRRRVSLLCTARSPRFVSTSQGGGAT